LLSENSGSDERAADIRRGEAKRRNAGKLPASDRVEHQHAFGAVGGCRRQQPSSWIALASGGTRQADPENDLANGHHADQPIGRPSPRAGTKRKEQQARLHHQQRACDGSDGTGRSRAAEERRPVAVRESAGLGDSREAECSSRRGAE
jgi:hypothetical protein